MLDKKLIRKKILAKRSNIGMGYVNSRSEEIVNRLTSLDSFQKSEKIMLYCSTDNEVSTEGLIRYLLKYKKVILPSVKNNQLETSEIKSTEELKKGRFGILEPKKSCKKIQKKEIDLVIVPGIAFDTKGNRVGYGKGFYDMFLKDMHVLKIGVAYEFQLLDYIASTSKDVKVDFIITEKRIIDCKNG